MIDVSGETVQQGALRKVSVPTVQWQKLNQTIPLSNIVQRVGTYAGKSAGF